MQNFKVLKCPSPYPDVLVYRDRDENYINLIKIRAFGTVGEDEDQLIEEEISFGSVAATKSFIENFNKDVAAEWCEEKGILY